MGCYPLKGKPINALAATTKELMDNKEFTELMTILGLKIGEKVKIEVDSLFEIVIDGSTYIVSTDDIIVHHGKQIMVKDLI
jgi:hypothetical protein